MEVLIFLLWAVPMFVSMAKDNDAPTTLTGIFCANGALWLLFWLINKAFTALSLPASPWWGIALLPLAVAAYYGVWCWASNSCSKLAHELVREIR